MNQSFVGYFLWKIFAWLSSGIDISGMQDRIDVIRPQHGHTLPPLTPAHMCTTHAPQHQTLATTETENFSF